MIRTQDVSWGVQGKTIIHEVSVSFPNKGLTAVLGPNGSGKTSLLHVIAGLRKPTSGQVFFGGEPIRDLKPKQRAKRIALVEQHPSTELDMSVRQVVELGRIPHIGSWPGARDKDSTAVTEAMVFAEVESFAERRWATLSGGERQRVHLARALAQRPEVLLLDEPTNHLDLSHQLDFLEKVSALDICTIAVLHDLDLAAAYCGEVVVMNHGAVFACGEMSETLSSGLIDQVFRVRARVLSDDRLRVNWSRE